MTIVIMADVVSDADEGHSFHKQMLQKSTPMLEELYLQTQAGGPQDLRASLLESKNLGSNEALSTRPPV